VREAGRASRNFSHEETSGLFFINYSLLRFCRNQFALLRFYPRWTSVEGPLGRRENERKKKKKGKRKRAFPISDPFSETRRFLSNVQLDGKY